MSLFDPTPFLLAGGRQRNQGQAESEEPVRRGGNGEHWVMGKPLKLFFWVMVMVVILKTHGK